MPSILLCADSLFPEASGGMVCLRLARSLAAAGMSVHVLTRDRRTGADTRDLSSVNYYPETGSGTFSRACNHLRSAWFRDLLKTVSPSVVHLCSLRTDKPPYLITESLNMGVRVVLQPWIHDHFCVYQFAYDNKRNTPCSRCLDTHMLSGFTRGCHPLAAGLFSAISRTWLRSAASDQRCVWISTATTTTGFIERYTGGKPRIFSLPLAFPPSRADIGSSSESDLFVAYGQPLPAKGFHLLPEIAARCPDAKIIYFPGNAGWRNLIRPENIPANLTIDEKLAWKTGVREAVASAKGILVTSLWPTTPEYVLLEALGFSRPVVAFSTGAHIDILRNNENALLCAPGDISEFSDNVRRLNSDQQLRIQLSCNAHDTFLHYTNEHALVQKLLHAYGLETSGNEAAD